MGQRTEHKGIVRNNDDPEKRARLLVECPTLVTGETLGSWVEPTFEFIDSSKRAGSVWIPSIGSSVTVMVEDERGAEVNGLEPKWKCDVYPNGAMPEEFKTNYPLRRGWVTGEGHMLIFDDTEGELVFYYKHPSGTEIRVTKDGEIQLSPATGQSVLIGDNADKHLVRGETLETYLSSALNTWLTTHTHPVAGAVASASALPAPTIPSDLLSDDHKVK